MTGAARPAVFLDRDGTLLTETGYLGDPEGLVLLPGAVQALRLLRARGYACVLVTNQSGVARGFFDEHTLARIHDRLQSMLAAQDAALDLILYCPHHPEVGEAPYRRTCACRKPAPGLLFQARERLGLDLERSWMIGDALRDLESGRRAGVRGLLVRTGKGEQELRTLDAGARAQVEVLDDVLAAAERIVSSAESGH